MKADFKVIQPIPSLRTPHVIAVLKPWIDAGSVGSLVIDKLERIFGGVDMAKLSEPGKYFDFTRYRPVVGYKEGSREIIIPNTRLTWAKTGKGPDYIFLHMLEPHNRGEEYVTKIWRFLEKLNLRRYLLVGGFYDMVPHTRPLLVSGTASGRRSEAALQKLGVTETPYEGPSSICNLIAIEAEKAGIETMSLMVHLPSYTELEEDYAGTVTLLRILNQLYKIPLDETDTQLMEAQLKGIEAAVQQNNNLQGMVSYFEQQYDEREKTGITCDESHFSPEVDKFLRQMEKRFQNP